MAPKTKLFAETDFPQDATSLDAAPQADLGEAAVSLSGPDAHEGAVDVGVDGAAEPASDASNAVTDADPAATSLDVAPPSFDQADAMLDSMSPVDREMLLAKWGVLWLADGPLTAPPPDFDQPAPGGALTPTGLADLERLLNEIGHRTSGGAVDLACRGFLFDEGAEVSEADGATVTLGGITTTSQFGLHRALLDWCMVATRRIMAGAM